MSNSNQPRRVGKQQVRRRSKPQHCDETVELMERFWEGYRNVARHSSFKFQLRDRNSRGGRKAPLFPDRLFLKARTSIWRLHANPDLGCHPPAPLLCSSPDDSEIKGDSTCCWSRSDCFRKEMQPHLNSHGPWNHQCRFRAAAFDKLKWLRRDELDHGHWMDGYGWRDSMFQPGSSGRSCRCVDFFLHPPASLRRLKQ